MPRVLVVDDEAGLRLSLAAVLKRDGYDVQTAGDVSEAMCLLNGSDVDVVMSDIIMPGESGVDLLSRIRGLDRGIEVVLMTGEPNVETASLAVRNGAFDYLAKPVSKGPLLAVVARAARAKAQRDLTEHLAAENERYRTDLEGLVAIRTAQLAAALRGTIGVIAQALETRDPYTAGHQRRVARLSLAIAVELDLPDDTRTGVEMAALVHDIGKIGIPAEILAKPTQLSPLERRLIETHADAGYQILRHVAFPWPIADVVLQHHERLDGSGYPAALVGSAVRREACILSVADVVEAMASYRPYRPALGIEAALNEIELGRGRLFDPLVVDACLRLFQEKGFDLNA